MNAIYLGDKYSVAVNIIMEVAGIDWYFFVNDKGCAAFNSDLIWNTWE